MDSQQVPWSPRPPNRMTCASNGSDAVEHRIYSASCGREVPPTEPIIQANTTRRHTINRCGPNWWLTKFYLNEWIHWTTCICTYIRWHSSTKNVWPFLLIRFFFKQLFKKHVKYYSLARVCWSDPLVPWDSSCTYMSPTWLTKGRPRYKLIEPLGVLTLLQLVQQQ